MAFSTFVAGQVLTAAQVNDYLMKQSVIVCTAATRPTGVEGMHIYETDTDRMYAYDGSAWVLRGWTTSTAAPGVILTDAAQSINSATATDITWGTETHDPDGWTSGASATLTVPTGRDGRYILSYQGAWAGSAGTVSAAGFIIGGTQVASSPNDGGVYSIVNTTIARLLTAGTTIKVAVYQNSGGALNITSRLEIDWIGR